MPSCVWNTSSYQAAPPPPLRCSAGRSGDDVTKPAPVDSTTPPAAPHHKCGCSTSRLADQLVTFGYCGREPSETDWRRVLLRPPQEGVDAAAVLLAAVEEVDARILGRLNEGERSGRTNPRPPGPAVSTRLAPGVTVGPSRVDTASTCFIYTTCLRAWRQGRGSGPSRRRSRRSCPGRCCGRGTVGCGRGWHRERRGGWCHGRRRGRLPGGTSACIGRGLHSGGPDMGGGVTAVDVLVVGAIEGEVGEGWLAPVGSPTQVAPARVGV